MKKIAVVVMACGLLAGSPALGLESTRWYCAHSSGQPTNDITIDQYLVDGAFLKDEAKGAADPVPGQKEPVLDLVHKYLGTPFYPATYKITTNNKFATIAHAEKASLNDDGNNAIYTITIIINKLSGDYKKIWTTNLGQYGMDLNTGKCTSSEK